MRTEKHVSLPWPPSTNALWRYTKRGVYRTAQYMAYIAECQVLHMHRGPPFDAPVSMQIIAHPPDKRIRDLDNLSKSLCDVAVKLNLLEDDHWIHELHMCWAEKISKGKIDMTIRLLTAQPVKEMP